MKKILLILTMGVMIFTTKKENLYPETGIIIDIDYTEDIVTFETFNGNQFSFYGCEDYMENDIVSIIMDNNGTENVIDDKIIKVKYSGYFEK